MWRARITYKKVTLHVMNRGQSGRNNSSDNKIRARLMVELREKAGLTSSEIAHMKLFRDVKYSSLSRIYKNEKVRNIFG
jgi:hypothetical protein